jgi:hypothetical protein
VAKAGNGDTIELIEQSNFFVLLVTDAEHSSGNLTGQAARVEDRRIVERGRVRDHALLHVRSHDLRHVLPVTALHGQEELVHVGDFDELFGRTATGSED